MFKASPAISTLKEDKHVSNKGWMETQVPFLNWLLAHPAPEFWQSDGGAHSFSLKTRESLPTLLRNLNLNTVYSLVDSWGWEVKERKQKEVGQIWKEREKMGERERERGNKSRMRRYGERETERWAGILAVTALGGSARHTGTRRC